MRRETPLGESSSSSSSSKTANHFDRAPLPLTRLILSLLTGHSIVNDKTALPPESATRDDDDAQLQDHPWVHGPIRMDYGYNVKSATSATRNRLPGC